ncbi:MAG TPA: MFS transporter [Ktedonobacterales bacterium]|nr:MFS transporter [Ktedonobacterales bacterium]
MGARLRARHLGRRVVRRGLINRSFALLWSGQVITDLGTVIFNTALVVWVAADLARDQVWAALAVSGVLAAATLPMLLVRPLAGVWVDRCDARRTMLCMDALRAALVALLAAAMLAPGLTLIPRLVIVYFVIFVVSACAQFFNTALLTLIASIVSEPELARAGGLSEATWSAASIAGPPLAAPLVVVLGVQWALLGNALSFIVSFLMLWLIPAGPQRERPAVRTAIRADLLAGLRFVARDPVPRVLITAMSLAMLGAGALRALDFFFVTQDLRAAAWAYGLVGPAFGGGSVIGALLAGRYTRRIGAARTLWVSMVAVGLLIVVLARQTTLPAALAVYVVFGIANSGANVALTPLLVGATPRELLGRANALFFTVISIALLVSVAAAGYLASGPLHGLHAVALGFGFDATTSLLTGGGLLICAGGLYARWRLRPATHDDGAQAIPQTGHHAGQHNRNAI